jgi:hypothetical protein
MKKILLLAVALLGAGHISAATNWLKITNFSQVPVKITVSYHASSQASCGADEKVLQVGEEFIFDKMRICAIASIKADEVTRVTEGKVSYWEVVRELRVLNGSRYRKSFEFVGPDANGAFSFEECPKFCTGKKR